MPNIQCPMPNIPSPISSTSPIQDDIPINDPSDSPITSLVEVNVDAEADAEADAEDAEEVGEYQGYVVCIGASAGGLDALERFFSSCPTNTGAAFVVVQHLSPDHKSMMSTLLARHTLMPVIMAEEDMALRENCVFLIPSGSIMHVSPGHLHLKPKKSHSLTLPIDIFFASLAAVYADKAVGIILSGTGTDGTKGAIAIRIAGGFLMAQDPESSKFDGMPRSVIATGHVHAVLTPEDMPARLSAHLRHEVFQEPTASSVLTSYSALSHDEAFIEILQLLYQLGGIDFSDYKPATILRRLERRMQIRHTHDLQQYLTLIDQDRDEMLLLRNEMLISVTSFFRDTDAFERLFEQAIKPLVEASKASDTLRVWVAGTATGEEAYSIAILFMEAFHQIERWPTLKIFATDVDHQAIEKAGFGRYRESIAAEISTDRLERFFVHKQGMYVVKSELRQCIVFARQNLLADPPFTKMDLVVCRNTLIYFKPPAQERVLHSLLYALNPSGILFLGSSESIAMMSDALSVVSAGHKLFRRTHARVQPLVEMRKKSQTQWVRQMSHGAQPKLETRVSIANAADMGAAMLLEQYAPPAIVFNEQQEAVHLFGDVNSFIQTKQGSASLAVGRLLLDPLVPIASALLFKSWKDKFSLQAEPIQIQMRNGSLMWVRLSAHALKNEGVERLTLLCFETEKESSSCPSSLRTAVDVSAETMGRILLLESELTATRENLQTTIEELETSNEELQATNEELMASNEELQSSNEELQSVNEELNTVNAEYQEKLLLLGKANADLESLSRATAVATIFVDADLQITRFTPDAAAVFKLRPSDLGRPLDDISHTLVFPTLMENLKRTLQTGIPLECEVEALSGEKTYFIRMLPYSIPSMPRGGAILSVIDVSMYHDTKRVQSILDGVPNPIALLDSNGTIGQVNAAWRRLAWAEVGANYLDVRELSSHAVEGVQAVLSGTLPYFSMQSPCHAPHEKRWFYVNVAPIPGTQWGAVVSHFNIPSNIPSSLERNGL
ncbi:MAG: hypothetical protein RIR79_1635 [Pseudomonadota bacterium]